LFKIKNKGEFMYLKEVEICPNCGERSKVLKKESYGDGMIKYSFQCPKCKLFYSSSWKEKMVDFPEGKNSLKREGLA
jgi:transposase-like protein